jgi:hypothetical protein
MTPPKLHKPPGCEHKKWPHIYPVTLLYICLMLTLITALLVKGVGL